MPRRSALSALSALGLAVTLALAGCGSASVSGGASAPATVPASSSTSGTAPTSVPTSSTTGNPTSPGPPTSPTSPPPTTPPASTTGPVTLTGIPERGVEASCLVMQGYTLTGGDRALLTSGAKVTVTGHTDAGMASFCQQGTILVLDTVVRVS